jgi:hypothetical protein
MKLYTDKSQTAKLIELGFEKPKSIRYPKNEMEAERVNTTDFLISDYSIGELLSFLPKSIKVNDLFFTLCIHSSSDYWIIEYADIAFGTQARLCKEELIDALFTEIVILKEEGVI